LPHEQHSGIKQLLINKLKGKKGYETQHVLNDVSFEIKKGDFFGIVGRNGSGKSTLLKILAGIYIPNKGHVQVNGSLTPFIELGVGFNAELTGRENVFLNGALLGFSVKEMEAMYDDIVEFAELEKFMDQKLKNYSSGMQVRLAFSVAIRAQGDILIIDEVLAVGDAAFQQKCFDYFEQLKREKKTIIIVTHDMGTVQRFCNRALLLGNGEIEDCGKPQNIALKYLEENELSQVDKSEDYIKNTKATKIVGVNILNHHSTLKWSDNLEILITVESTRAVDAMAGVSILNSQDLYIGGYNSSEKQGLSVKVGKNEFRCRINTSVLSSGEYKIGAMITTKGPNKVTDTTLEGPRFRVVDSPKNKDGIICMQGEWL
jgi:ABC-2 type transport system ATP-binding protein